MALQPVASSHGAPHRVRPIPAVLNGRALEPNRGMKLSPDWVDQVRVNTSAVERRAATHTARRTVKKENQAAWLLRAVACMDLTTLTGDDTADRVRRLCAKARNPLQRHIVEGLGIEELQLTVGAVCVYHALVETAVQALEGAAFRSPRSRRDFRRACRRWPSAWRRFIAAWRPARTRSTSSSRARMCSTGNWQALYDEIARMREACGDGAHEGDSRHRRSEDAAQCCAAMVAMMAGADFIKTSTGKEAVNATLPVASPWRAASATIAERPASRSASSRRAASARPRSRSTGWC